MGGLQGVAMQVLLCSKCFSMLLSGIQGFSVVARALLCGFYCVPSVFGMLLSGFQGVVGGPSYKSPHTSLRFSCI